MAECIVEKRSDFTVMGNHHFRNRDLSLKAKGLLSIMFSLNDDWDYSILGLATLSRDGVDSVRSAIKELEAQRYIKRIRRRNSKGVFVVTQYLIREFPMAEDDAEVLRLQKEPYEPEEKPKNAWNKRVSPTKETPQVENPPIETPLMEIPLVDNRTQYSTNKSSTNKSSIYKSNPNQSNQESEPMVETEQKIDEIGSDEYEEIYKTVCLNIEYDHFEVTLDKADLERVDEMVEIMVETLANTNNKINISGQDYSATIVKNRFLKIDSSHIEYVLSSLDRNTTKVCNIKRYLLTTLFNAPTTMNNYYSSLYSHHHG